MKSFESHQVRVVEVRPDLPIAKGKSILASKKTGAFSVSDSAGVAALANMNSKIAEILKVIEDEGSGRSLEKWQLWKIQDAEEHLETVYDYLVYSYGGDGK